MNILKQIILYNSLAKHDVPKIHEQTFIRGRCDQHCITVNAMNTDRPYYVSAYCITYYNGFRYYGFYIQNNAWRFIPSQYANYGIFAQSIYNMYIKKINERKKQK